MIKLVAFDLWKTLAYRDVDYSSTGKILEYAKIGMPKRDFEKLFEETIQTRRWSSKEEAFRTLLERIGIEPTDQNIRKAIEIRDYSESAVKVYPFSVPMLKQLKERGYKRGLVSNSTVFSIEILKSKTDLLDNIDYPVFSFEVGTIKPDVRMFEEVLRRADCAPEEAVMVGDKLDDDVIPAREIGMHAVKFENYEQLKKDLASIDVSLD